MAVHAVLLTHAHLSQFIPESIVKTATNSTQEHASLRRTPLDSACA